MDTTGAVSRSGILGYHGGVRLFVTGVTGFVGRHLAAFVSQNRPDVEVWGVRRWRSSAAEEAGAPSGVRLLYADLLDPPSLVRALRVSRPDAVVHLAASSSVARSWETPTEMLQANVLGTVHLLEAVRQVEMEGPVVLACSAEAYGLVEPAELPITEAQPFRPVSPYAVSKAAVDLLGFQYFRAFGVRTVRLRLFNHGGPGQSDHFVMAAFARQLAEIEAGRRGPRLCVGNLEVQRDFVDVRDAARAYWLAVERGEPGEAYNVASGRARSLREMLAGLLAMSDAAVEVVTDPARLRPADVPVLAGTAEKFRHATGWRPEVPFDVTLRDTLDYWRQAVRRGQ